MKDYSFQGKCYIGLRNSDGTPGKLTWVGDASVLQVKLATATMTRNESWSGKRLQSVLAPKTVSATLTLTLSEFSPLNLALALYGSEVDVTTGTVTAEQLPASLALGDVIALANRDVSALVLTDSTTSSPKTLVADTDYRIDSAAGGIVEFIGDLSSYIQPLKAAYSYAAAVRLPLFTSGMPERYIVFDGVNTVSNETVKVRLYRAVFEPAKQLDLISADLGTLELDGSVLFDQTNAADANLGGFGRIEMASAA